MEAREERQLMRMKNQLTKLDLLILDEFGAKVAKRFELFMSGMEVANGYLELVNAQEQLQRFKQDNQLRRNMNRVELTIDTDLVDALEHGLPSCSGVALGLDRLVMLALNAESIDEVMSFPLDYS